MKFFISVLFIVTLATHTSFAQVKVDTLEAHKLWEEGERLVIKSKMYQAITKFRDSGKLFQQAVCEVRYADCLNYEGVLLYYLKIKTQRVFYLHNKALQIYKRKLGNNHVKVGMTYRRLGDYYSSLLIYNTNATTYYRKAINILKEKNNLWVARVWGELGNLYSRQKKIAKAKRCYESYYKQLQKIYKPGDKRFQVFIHQMGVFYLRQGENNLALEYFRKRYSYGNRTEGIYRNLGQVYLNQGKNQKALIHFRQALTVAKKRYPGKHLNIGDVYCDIGNVYLRWGKYKNALDQFQRGLYYLIDDFQDSVNIYHQTKYNDSNHSLHYIRLLSAKAKAFQLLSHQLKDLKSSLYNYQSCDSLLNHLQNLNHQQYDQITISSNYISKIYPSATKVCQRLYAKTKNLHYQQLAFYFAEKSHSSFLVKSLHARKAKLQANLPDSIIDQELYLQQQLSFFQRKSIIEKDSIQKLAYQDSLFVFTQKRETLNEILAKKFPKYYKLRFQNKPATIEQIQQKLDRQTVLLNYDFGEEQSRVFVVTKTDFQIVPLARQSTLTKVLNRYYEAIQNEASPTTFVTKSYEVYKTLFQSIENFLKGKTKLVIANPTLLSVPLGAVIDQNVVTNQYKFSHLPYLIKKYAISYHYSASLWLQSQEGGKSTKTKSFIGMAPFSGGKSKAVTTRGNQGLLPESKKEINTIFNFFKQKNLYAEAYLSKAATKQQFLNRLKDFDILHIASHSTANLREERLAKIHFAPQQNPDSTYLYAESIYYLPLKAQLVVLSSCESGVGKFAPGEGVMSLARGFLHAGAKNVISSLWEADDQYTKKLMVLLYQQILFRHKTYTQALHTAKNQLIAQEPYLHPKYWSSFILIGK
ncbi:hypothetical protein BKI52_36835 [marine bacterium AO1-C]|nr:hypothetical protein BKI52_36835 [marine bacterium AO1-C]